MNANEVFNGKFDYDTHNETFERYCEVVILKDGTIEYSVPSHQEKLKQVYRDMFGTNPDEDCPRERYCDYLDWLCEQTESCVVWYSAHSKAWNGKQRKKLYKLQERGCCNFKDGWR